MAEPRKVAATGPVMRFPSQTAEHLAKISERHCPVGWELELVQAAGVVWGACKGCGHGYRIAGGVLEYVELARKAITAPGEAFITITWGEKTYVAAEPPPVP